MRTTFGVLSATLCGLSVLLCWISWFKVTTLQGADWITFPLLAAGFVTHFVTIQVLKPHYVVDRTLQIDELRPFLAPRAYASLWVVFAGTLLGALLGLFGTIGAEDGKGHPLRFMSPVAFGFFYLDAVVLLLAKFPLHTDGRGEA
jgi:hypothetical protein